MKVKYSVTIIFLMIFSLNAYAQYEMSIKKDTLLSDNQYEFDVYIMSTSGKINLTSYQIILTFNEAIKNNGELRFEYLAGSSELTNTPHVNVGILDGYLLAASGPGSDTISTVNLKVGTFRITSSKVLGNYTPNVDWNFNGHVRTEVNINNINTTNPSNHINLLDNSILPVELISFLGKVNNSVIKLNWTTRTELNNYGFQIERSVDNKAFEKIGFVKGNGTTTEPHDYYFTDNNIAYSSKFLYRLKQIDNNGECKYSKELEIEVTPKQYKLYQNYPNPFNPSTTIKFGLPKGNNVNLTIYNILGQKIKTIINGFLEAGYHTFTFDGANLPSGTYIYCLQIPNFIQTKKMLLVK